MIQTSRARSARAALAAAVSSIALVALACQTPVGVEVADPNEVERELTESILVGDRLSHRSLNMLRWAGLKDAYLADRPGTLARVHRVVVAEIAEGEPMARDALVTLAEMSFDIGKRSREGSAGYFLQSLVYAYAFLDPEDPQFDPSPWSPRTQLALGLYNRGLARAFAAESVTELQPRAGRVELPFGHIDVEIDEESRRWENRVLDTFTLASDLRVRGLRNRYRYYGLGTPLAASIRDDEESPPPADRLFGHVRIPVAALLGFEDFWAGFARGEFQATLAFRVGYDTVTETIDGEELPLAMEPTASLAYMLTEASPWRHELAGFFQGDLTRDEGDGLKGLQPYRRGKIPVILVHGTASGPARWAELLNDLIADDEIRERFQFWLFTYNTGNPIAYSGWLLREEIRSAIEAIDPDDRDDALDRMIVMGHSQGGLLTKLTAIDSGMRLWDEAIPVPPDELDLAPESKRIIEGSLIVKPVPEVERVVFMATPHRGSFVAAWGISQWFGRMTTTPANLANAVSDLLTQDEIGVAVRRLDRVDGAVANMSPRSEFIQTLADIPVVPQVKAHSIVAVRGGPPYEGGSDGVVEFESASIDGVQSELVIDSDHSVQNHPLLSQEVRRILLQHIGLEREIMERIELRGARGLRGAPH